MTRQPNDAPPSSGPVTERGTIEAHAPEATLLGCSVRVLHGDAADVGRTLSLARGTAIIGSAEGCDLVLHDRRVSRRHLELRVERAGVSVRDLGSTNGTFVLGARVEHALLAHGSQLVVGNTTLALAPLAEDDAPIPLLTSYGALVGESTAMRKLFGLLQRLETSEAPVLISAETGTGKELVARALHEHGVRRDKPFVVFDCGSVTRELVESELFGHARGAFTGAQGERTGVFEQAHGGTLFLDEIGELPLDLQTRLLRALERGEIKRVGENGYRKVDVRVVAATHRDLAAAVKSGAFREDLFYRVAVVSVAIPALRERPEDIAPLARHFARLLGAEREVTAPVITHLSAQPWPGNARELRNAVQRIAALGAAEALKSERRATQPVGPAALPAQPATDESAALPYREAKERLVEEFESRYVHALLDKHGGNVSAAARAAQMSRRHFHELLRKHGLRVDD